MGEGAGVSTARVATPPRSMAPMARRSPSRSMASCRQLAMVSFTSGWSGGSMGPAWLSWPATWAGDTAVGGGWRVELEVEGAAEPLAEGEPPGTVDAGAEGGVQYELHAPGLVEEAL